jgi:hypothetical protein
MSTKRAVIQPLVETMAMATVHRPHPFQKLRIVPGTTGRPSVILAAAGPSLRTYDLSNKRLLCQGPPFREVSDACNDSINGPSPSKRRKLDHSSAAGISREASEESVEIVAERKKGQRKRPKVEESRLPNVSHILSTANGATIIAVTTEDKCITVFTITKAGELLVESRR